MSLSDVVILGLATYRLTLLFTEESGPFDIFGKLRLFCFNRTVYTSKFGDIHNKDAPIWEFLTDLLLCRYCLSGWIALALLIPFEPVVWFRYLFAAWGIAVLFYKLEDSILEGREK